MSQITVVGASGYLGGRIALGLQSYGHDVIGVYRKADPYVALKLKNLSGVLTGDVTDEAFLGAVAGLKSDYVIYLVSLNHSDCEKSYLKSINVNVAPLVELGRQLSLQPEFKRLIYMSTFQVYGLIKAGERITDDRPGKPVNIYGLNHQQCEHALAFLKESIGLDSISLRLSNGYGAPAFPSCDCWWLVVNDFCRSAVIKSEIQLMSDGSPQRDFLHISDITKAIDSVCALAGELPLTMNLASGNTLTMLELAHLVSAVFEQTFNTKARVLFPGRVESVHSTNLTLRFRALTESLSSYANFTPAVPFGEGVAEVLRFVHENRGLFQARR